MAELQTLANYAEIFGALTVLGGLLFAGLQIRGATRQRRDAAATALLTSYMDNPVIVEHAHRIMTAGDILEAVEEDPTLRQAIAHINAVSESIGFMVHNGSITIQQAADWGGGGIVATWKKLEPYARQQRAESGRNGAYDWYQWLATQLERHTPDRLHSTIMERYSDWKPGR